MNTLMIHEVNDEHIHVMTNDCMLTFDDGLFSQYSYIDQIRETNTNDKLFFITPSLVYDKDVLRLKFQDNNFPNCVHSMEQHFLHNNNYNYMTQLEIQYISAHSDIRLGAHSFFHDVILVNRPRDVPSWRFYKYSHIPDHIRHLVSVESMLTHNGVFVKNGKTIPRTEKQLIQYIKKDTECCLEWFQKYLNYQPIDYCFPFNSSSELLIDILTDYGFRNFYGGERTPIEGLL